MLAFLQVLVAYIVVDAATALFHWATDRGWNLPRIVRNFQKHHREPRSMTFDLEPAIVGVPLMAAAFYCWPWFLGAMGFFTTFAQVPHYYTHHPAPAFIRLLQRWRIILPPQAHASHHQGDFDRDFCVVSGWNNWWINRLVRRLPKP